jgi:hypothetical protein
VASLYNKFPTLDTVDKNLHIDVSSVVGKPFWTETVTWTTTSTNPILADSLPTVAINSSKHLAKAFSLGALSRYKMCAHVSLTGTIAHQGLLLLAAVPVNANNNFTSPQNWNTLLSCPHVFLSANEATSTCIDIPFYSPQALVTPNPLGDDTPNLNSFKDTAQLIIVQMVPLAVGTGASTSVSIVVEYEFKQLEIYVPRPIVTDMAFTTQSLLGDAQKLVTSAADTVTTIAKTTSADLIDRARAAFRYYTGLDNPNQPELNVKMIRAVKNNLNSVDEPTRLEKMDPYVGYDRVYTDDYFQTTNDEMNISNIISKPQFLGQFTTSTSDTVGKVMWARPISPCQGFSNIGSSNGVVPIICNNIEYLYYATRAWKGKLKIYIQSVMTPKHICRLQVVRYYAPSPTILNAATVAGLPTMQSLTACPKDTIEFNSGGQIAEVDLSYNAKTKVLFNTKDLATNAMQHGMYYIYLQQPLVAGDNVPSSVTFNVYMSCGEDFQFFGYATDQLIATNLETLAKPSHLPVIAGDLTTVTIPAPGDVTKPPVIPKKPIITTSGPLFKIVGKPVRAKVANIKPTPMILPTYNKIVKGEEIEEEELIVFEKRRSDYWDALLSDRKSWPLHFWLNFFRLDRIVFLSLLELPENTSLNTAVSVPYRVDWSLAKIQNRSLTLFNPSILEFPYSEFQAQSLTLPFYAQSMDKEPDCTAAPTLIKPACQDLLVEPKDITPSVDDSLFRPLTSVRDLVRRFQANYISNNSFSTTSRLFTLPLASFLQNILNANSMGSNGFIPMMFYGQTGGIKLKVKAYGVSNMSVKFIPPMLGYDKTNNLFTKATPSGAALATSNLLDDYTNPGCLPTIEMSQTFTSGAIINNGADVSQTCLFEFVIPNVNIFGFLVRNYVNSSSNVNSPYPITQDLGDLVFNLPASTATSTVVNFVYYSACTDETRFGFHTHCPVLSIPVKTVPLSPSNFISPYNNLNAATSTTLPISFAPVPFAYYSTVTIPGFN